MTRTFSSSARTALAPAYRVEAPHASDAIGLALRCAFENESGLPDEMARMLRELDGLDTKSAH